MTRPGVAEALGAVVGGYVVGSLPVAWLAVRSRRGVDLRREGRHGTGAVGALMAAGPRTALLSVALELVKGIVVGVGARLYIDEPWFIAAAIAGCVAGDAFPLVARRGRRGLVPLLAGGFVALPQALMVGAVVAALGMILIDVRGRALSAVLAVAVPAGLVVGTRDPATLAPAALIVLTLVARREIDGRRHRRQLERWRQLRDSQPAPVIDVAPQPPPPPA